MTEGACAEDGTTLIEVLVAMLVFASGVLAIAQLFLVAAAANVAARGATIATSLAAQKVEQLLSEDLADGEQVDHIDAWGRVSGTGETTPPNAVYTRRWSIEAISSEAVSIRVRVGRSRRDGQTGRMAGETQLTTIRRRAQ